MTASHHRARKRFGQNFLVDTQVIAQIITRINPKPCDHIIEIGPGLGALTTPLADVCQRMTLIEIDRDLIPHLQQQFSTSKINIVNQDVLTVDFSRLALTPPLRIIGNLPYNISTPILFHLLNFIDIIQDIHVMLQKEVVDRIVASPNCKAYGRLTIMLQAFYDPTLLLVVNHHAFNPPPKVQSAILKLTPKSTPLVSPENFASFSNVVQMAFNQRRKTLRNSLKSVLPSHNTAHLSIDLSLRPEQLTIGDFVSLAEQLKVA